jgi:Uma2 family endonuclease
MDERRRDTAGGSNRKDQKEQEIRYFPTCREGIPDGNVQEAAGVYQADPGLKNGKKQGEYTLEDYQALPDDERWELIDGFLIRMDAPTSAHQIILGDLYTAFRRCIDDHNAPCKALLSPLDVQLDMDDRTIVEPDLIVLCDREKLKRKRIFGAPDLLVEILSPSSHSKDTFCKNSKYQKAGVREYWMVDPEKRKVLVNLFEKTEGEYRSRVYNFDEKIPVGISKGECRIDFAPILKELEELEEPEEVYGGEN